jgi:phosphoglycolate phosphatase
MFKQFDLVVFDWDGTLMDSAAAIVRAIQSACRDLGVAEPSDVQARHVIGLGLGDALRLAVPDLDEAHYPQMTERYRHHYLSSDHELELFGGVPALLEQLKGDGYLLAVATGKSRIGLDRALDHSGLRPNFDATRCADECFSKPHPQMLEELLDEFAVPAKRCLMIGDTTHDLQMAINAGVAGVGVTYGAHAVEQLRTCAPLACIDSVAELTTWLKTNA